MSDQERFHSTYRPVLSASVSVNAAATGSIVAAIPAVAGGPGTGLPGTPAQTIEVVGFFLTGDTTATTAQFLSSTGSIALTGPMIVPVDGQLSAPQVSDKYFKTAPGDALQIAAVTGKVTGWVNYILSPGTNPT